MSFFLVDYEHSPSSVGNHLHLGDVKYQDIDQPLWNYGIGHDVAG